MVAIVSTRANVRAAATMAVSTYFDNNYEAERIDIKMTHRFESSKSLSLHKGHWT